MEPWDVNTGGGYCFSSVVTMEYVKSWSASLVQIFTSVEQSLLFSLTYMHSEWQ